MPDPNLDQHTDEIPNASETTAAFDATLHTSTAYLEAQMQAIVAESTARLGEALQTMRAEAREAKIKALIAEVKPFRVEELPRQFYIPEPNLVASSASLSAGLEVVETETRNSPTALQQNPLLHTTDRDGSLRPIGSSFWGDLATVRQTFDEAATAIKFESPKGR